MPLSMYHKNNLRKNYFYEDSSEFEEVFRYIGRKSIYLNLFDSIRIKEKAKKISEKSPTCLNSEVLIKMIPGKYINAIVYRDNLDFEDKKN